MTRALLLCSMVLVAGCNERSPRLTLPSVVAAPQVSAPALVTLAGTVYEHTTTGPRPLPNVPLDISVEFQSHPPTVTSDGDGRYAFRTAPGQELKVVAVLPGYSQPCRVATVTGGDAPLDVHLVPDDVLQMTGIPASLPVLRPAISGTVFERTANGVQPIPGVRIIADFTAGDGWAPSATTLTDGSGRYVLCAVLSPLGLGLHLSATKNGFRTGGRGFMPQDGATYDIELVRE